MARPVALPEIFTGEGNQSWTDWVDHFESVAEVNEWDGTAKKKWIRARLIGRAATALRRLSEDDRSTYVKITAALKKRFEPECRKEVYIAEFQAKRKKRSEDWASFAEDLRTLAEKAYPSLEAAGQELLVLNQFLSQLDDPQLALGVRQRTPTTVDAAVAAALEIETYLHPRKTLSTVSMVHEESGPSDSDDTIAGVAYRRKCMNEDSLQKILDRLDKLELQVQTKIDSSTGSRHGGFRPRGKQPALVCWSCSKEGHLSRNCPLKARKPWGNEKPLEQ